MANATQPAQFSVGSVEGVPFTACTSGPDIIILASNFSRVQRITTNSNITALDCSTDLGKIAASNENVIEIFEPIPLGGQQMHLQQQQTNDSKQANIDASFTNANNVNNNNNNHNNNINNHNRLDYKWIYVATIESETPISVMSFNLKGSRLITGGTQLQMWALIESSQNLNNSASSRQYYQSIHTNGDGPPTSNNLGNNNNNSNLMWQCIWKCTSPSNIEHLKYSPDGTLFYSVAESDRLVKIWYERTNPSSNPNASLNTNVIHMNAGFVYVAHPRPVTSIEWRRTSKYTTKGAMANVFITSCEDDIARVWVQTLLPINFIGLHFHLSAIIESNLEVPASSANFSLPGALPQSTNSHPTLVKTKSKDFLSSKSSANSVDFNGSQQSRSQLLEEPKEDTSDNNASKFVVHWVNNKEIHITRSIEVLLHDMLIRILKGDNPTSVSSASSTQNSAGESCSESETHTDDLDGANDDTITAESSKKLRHKLCRKMNKKRALAASGRLYDEAKKGGVPNQNRNTSGKTSPSTSLVEEFDRTRELLLRKWSMTTDLLFSINKTDGTITFWQAKYLDGEDLGVYRQVQIERLVQLEKALPIYDATTMSLNVTSYSPSAYLDVKRAYLAVTGHGSAGGPGSSIASCNEQPDTSSVANVDSTSGISNNQGASSLTNKSVEHSLFRDTNSSLSFSDNEPGIFLVSQHLSGVLGLWKFNFLSSYPKLQSVDLVTKITGLPIDPSWLQDGTLKVQFEPQHCCIYTKWLQDKPTGSMKYQSGKSSPMPVGRSPKLDSLASSSEAATKSSVVCNFPSMDEDHMSKNGRQKSSSATTESQAEASCDTTTTIAAAITRVASNGSGMPIDSYKASRVADEVKVLPQYHLKQLIELLAFGRLQRVKAILNHLVSCLIQLEQGYYKDEEHQPHEGPGPWAHRSRTLSIVSQSSPTFRDSFDIENPSSTIKQQVIEEIELDYYEAHSIRPLPLYSLLEADNETNQSAGKDTTKTSSGHEEFSASYESVLKSRSQVDETLDEILGQSTLDTINKHKELARLASDAAAAVSGEGQHLTSFNPRKAKLLTQALTHTHLPGLSNVDQMHLLAVADAVALFDASPEDLEAADEDGTNGGGASSGVPPINIAIDSLDDRGLRFLTAMRQHVYLARCLPMNQRAELRASGIGNHNLVWAYHSDSQDELISLIPCMQRNKPEWAELREYGVGWWLKKLEVLRKLIEKVALSTYQTKQDPLDTALFYLAMKKKSLVCALLRRVNCDKRLLKLFEQDFNDPVNRKKALKNAYALLGLHRFEHAAAFFILAGSIWDAVEVCINNLNDIQLAIVLIRLHDSDSNLPVNLRKLLYTEILGAQRSSSAITATSIVGSDPISPTNSNSLPNSPTSSLSVQQEFAYDPRRAHSDPFLRSMALWTLGDYLSAVQTLLEGESSVSASVFNFYLFLKEQPLVVKHGQKIIEQLAEKERHLFFETAQSYLTEGCPMLALEVLKNNSSLDVERAHKMKFLASVHILLNELQTLSSGSLEKWLKRNAEALGDLCSYSGAEHLHAATNRLEDVRGLGDDSKTADQNHLEGDETPTDDEHEDNLDWIQRHQPLLRLMLTYCNMHGLTSLRAEIRHLLQQVSR